MQTSQLGKRKTTAEHGAKHEQTRKLCFLDCRAICYKRLQALVVDPIFLKTDHVASTSINVTTMCCRARQIMFKWPSMLHIAIATGNFEKLEMLHLCFALNDQTL